MLKTISDRYRMLTAFFLLLAISCGAKGQTLDQSNIKSISLTKTELTVTPVSLTCEAELASGAIAREIRVRRLTPGGFVWFAKINYKDGIQTNKYSTAFNGIDIFNNIQVVGSVGQNSRIQVTWPTLEEKQVFGQYRCDMVYEKQYMFRYGQSDKVDVGGIDELMDKIKSLASQGGSIAVFQSQIDALRARSSDLGSQLNALQRLSGLTGDLMKQVSEMSTQISEVAEATKQASTNTQEVDELQKQFVTLQQSNSNADSLIQKVNNLVQEVGKLEESDKSIKQIENEFEKINKQISQLNTDSDNANALDAKVNDLLKQVKVLQSEAHSGSKASANEYNVRRLVWPAGTYSLLMPRTGCPSNNLVSFSKGTRVHYSETSSGNNQNSNSTADHMPLDLFTVKGGNYLATLNYCTHRTSKPGVVGWPKGSYCINKKGRCPSGFKQGNIRIDDEDVKRGPQINKRSGVTPDGSYGGNTIYQYCCRSDRSPDKKIFLPVAQPFYLYRYKGTCQEVYGMDVSNDNIVLDTANDDPGSRGNNIDRRTAPAPDGVINNIHYELCYYKYSA